MVNRSREYRLTYADGFGSILAAAIIAGMEGKAGLAGWRWLCELLVRSDDWTHAAMRVAHSQLDNP